MTSDVLDAKYQFVGFIKLTLPVTILLVQTARMPFSMKELQSGRKVTSLYYKKGMAIKIAKRKGKVV